MKYLILGLALLFVGCAERGTEPGLKVLVGGTLEPSLDAAPIESSVIVIADGKIRALGPQASTPIPEGAETIDTRGKLIRPMPYDITLAPGSPADLMLFNAETGAPDSIMQAGEWVR